MDCNRIPAPDLWDDEPAENLAQYRIHLQFCSACRARVLNEAPEKLLFDLQEDNLPEDFWLGFWNSVDRKQKQPQSHRDAEENLSSASLRLRGGIQNPYSIIRWAAVLVFGSMILLYGRTFPEPEPVRQFRSGDYPVIESIGNPDARYYILQTSKEQKVVMVFDPGMEL